MVRSGAVELPEASLSPEGETCNVVAWQGLYARIASPSKCQDLIPLKNISTFVLKQLLGASYTRNDCRKIQAKGLVGVDNKKGRDL